MPRLITICVLALCLAGAMPARAETFSADISGMRITITQPWYLFTHGTPSHEPERLFFTLMEYFPEGGDIIGEGWAAEYPLAKGQAFPSDDQLKRLSPEALEAFVRDLDQNHTGFTEPKSGAALVSVNGFIAIAYKETKRGTPEAPGPSYNFSCYFPLGDRLIFLYAYVYGGEEAAKTLEGICASFVPAVDSGQNTGRPEAERNSVSGNGMRLYFPPTWDALMTGTTGDSQSWAELVKYSNEDRRIAKVSILSPVPADSLPDARDIRARLDDPDRDNSAVFLGLGTRAPMEDVKIQQRAPVKLGGFPASLTVVAGTVEDKEVVLELRDMLLDGELFTLVTGYPTPLPDDVRRDLEAVYAAFVPTMR